MTQKSRMPPAPTWTQEGAKLGYKETFDLSLRLFRRTIGAKYRKSFGGYLWIFIPAIAITLGVSLASHAGVINPGRTNLPYSLFVFIGTLIWQVFAEAVEVPYRAIEGARSYITRVMFPREAIILVQLYEALINTFVRLALVLVLVALFATLSFKGAGQIALCFFVTILLAVGVGGLLAPFMLLFADLYNTLKLILAYGLFLTPALYMPRDGGIFATLVRWNPISPIMINAREAANSGRFDDPMVISVMLVISLMLAVLAVFFVRRSVPVLVERMLLGGR
jgi:lipopolysaccharide transport system permease protein